MMCSWYFLDISELMNIKSANWASVCPGHLWGFGFFLCHILVIQWFIVLPLLLKIKDSVKLTLMEYNIPELSVSCLFSKRQKSLMTNFFFLLSSLIQLVALIYIFFFSHEGTESMKENYGILWESLLHRQIYFSQVFPIWILHLMFYSLCTLTMSFPDPIFCINILRTTTYYLLRF